jgi:hypothetical protein
METISMHSESFDKLFRELTLLEKEIMLGMAF